MTDDDFRLDNPMLVRWEFASEERLEKRNQIYRQLIEGVTAEEHLFQAIAEVFFFVEFNPLADFTGGENGLPGVPTPSFYLGFTTLHFTTGWSLSLWTLSSISALSTVTATAPVATTAITTLTVARA